MSLKNASIFTRMSLGFGVVLLFLMAVIAVATLRLGELGSVSRRIVDEGMVKSTAASVVQSTTKENSRRTMELFFITDPLKTAQVYSAIEANKKSITESLHTLERLETSSEGRALLGQIGQARSSYVASFDKVNQLLRAEDRAEASLMLMSQTLPKLDSLQEQVAAMTDLQRKQVSQDNALMEAKISSTRLLLLVLGGVAVLFGLASALLLTRSVTEPLHEALLIADTVAAGDLSQDFETSRGGEFGQLLSSMGDMEDTLTDLVTRIKESTASISVASRQNASGNAELSQRTESQSSSLLDTASNIEKLTSTVRQNSQREQAANDQALDASNFAQRGGSAGRDVVETMQAIRAGSKKIVPLRSAEAAKEIKGLIGHPV